MVDQTSSETTTASLKRPAPQAGRDGSENDDDIDRVKCSSTEGTFVIEVHRKWSPNGAARFLDLVRDGAYDGTVIYRVVRKLTGEPEACQFGFIKNETLRHKWADEAPPLKDDPQIFAEPNFRRGMISFAGSGPNSRRTDLFITFMTGNANGNAGAPWEVPFGIISEDDLINVVGKFNGTGDLGKFGGNAPDLMKGYEALKTSNPDIAYLGNCIIVAKQEQANGALSHEAAAIAAKYNTKCLESWRCTGMAFFVLVIGVVAICPAVRVMPRIFLRRRGKKQ